MNAVRKSGLVAKKASSPTDKHRQAWLTWRARLRRLDPSMLQPITQETLAEMVGTPRCG
jgi:hypothetical protein